MPKFTFTSPVGEEYELEGPEGSTREQAFNILQEGIKSGYYKPKSKGVAVIPGQEGEEQRVAALQKARKEVKGPEQLTNIIKGVGETALNLGTGFFAGIQAPIAAGIKRATGMVPDWEKETARLMEEQTYAPKTEKGQDYAANVGEFINRYVAPLGPGNLAGLAQPRPIGLMKGNREPKPIKASPEITAKMAELKAKKEAESKVTPVSEFEQAARELAESRYRDDQTVARLEAAIEKQNPQQALMRADAEGNVWTKDNQLVQDKINELDFNKTKQEAAQLLLEERQRALEQEVAQKAQLDFNAAERARQEAASTGLSEYQDMLRQQAEQRIPGDNTPLDFTNEVPPHGLQETPYQYKGGIDFTPFAAEQGAMPVEKQMQVGEAWKQRAIERQAEQDAIAKQEQRIQELEDTLMPLEEQLREQQYTPDLQGQGPKTREAKAALTAGPRRKQGGGIDPQLIEDFQKVGQALKRAIERKFGMSSDLVPDIDLDWATGEPYSVLQWAKSYDEHRHLLYGDGINPLDDRYQKIGSSEKAAKLYERDIAEKYNLEDEFKAKHALDQFRVGKFGQGGGIHPQVFEDLGKLASGVKRLVSRPTLPDTLLTPRSTENIAAKQAKRAKAQAIGSDAYSSVTTMEEALNNPGKDLSGITQEFGAGIGGAVRRNTSNKPLKYVRHLLDEATGQMNAFLKQYVTDKNNGFNGTYEKLNKQERIDAYKVKMWLSENEMDYSPELGKELGLSPAVQKHLEARQTAYAEMARMWGEMNLEKGFEPFEPRQGYLPSIWDGVFKALVGEYHTDKNGNKSFKISDVISVKSRKEFNDALKHYEGKEIIKLGKDSSGRVESPKATGSRFGQRDDVMYLLTQLAAYDERFADVKQELSSATALSNKGYLGYGVHELEKKGVGGFKGKKPWLSEADNMRESLEAEIQYFDQAAKYVSSQKLLDNTHDLSVALQEQGNMPNTVNYLNKYLEHVSGKNVHSTAAAITDIADAAAKAIGHVGNAVGLKVPENPRGALQGVGTAMNAMLMNIVNFPMFATQLAQLYQAGTPEAIRVQQQYGLSPAQFASSMARGHIYRSIIPALDKVGLLDKSKMPEHMVEAYQWLKKHGMEDFNEVMLSQDILESKAVRNIKQAAFWPTVIPEKFTRPTMFMWMVDMFHHAGLDTPESIRRAKYATDYAMTDYRPEEAPLVYNRLGVLSPETSALQRFKHNALEQAVSRLKESPEHKAAAITYLGLSIALGGLVGLPMMQELDELVVKPITKATGKEQSARELLMASLPSGAVDGLASAHFGLDIGSRFSLADVAPNSFIEGLAGARLSKVMKIGEAAYDAGWKYQDEQSLKQLGKELVPSGLAQAYQEAFMANEKGQLLNKKGQIATGVERGPFPSKSALTNFRPLEEKVQSELNYTKNQRLVKIQEKQTEASDRMKIALLNGNKDNFQYWFKKYQENEGNVESLGSIIEDAYKKGFITEKQRLEGTPGKTPMSIRRFQEMQR